MGLVDHSVEMHTFIREVHEALKDKAETKGSLTILEQCWFAKADVILYRINKENEKKTIDS